MRSLLGLCACALLFRLIVWASTRRAMNRVSREWVTQAQYWRGGDDL